MKKTLLLLALLIMLMPIVFAGDEIIIDDTVYINNSKTYISATPNIRQGSGMVELEFHSKLYTGDVNFVLGFNSEDAVPRATQYYNPKYVTTEKNYYEYLNNVVSIQTTTLPCEIGTITFNPIKRKIQSDEGTHVYCFDSYTTNETTATIIHKEYYTEFIEWHDLSNYEKFNHNLDGKDTWYVIKNISITAGDTHKLRFFLKVKKGSTGKYDFAAYPSSYDYNVLQAYNDNKLMLLDPIYNDTNDYAIAYYKLEENAFNYSDEVSNLDLTGGNIPDREVGGIIDNRQNFEDTNNDFLYTANSESFEMVNPFISYWITIESCTYNSLINTYYRNPSSPYQRYGFMSLLSYNSCPSPININIADGTATVNTWRSNVTVTTSLLYHIVTYYDGTNTRLWINGTEYVMNLIAGSSGEAIGYPTGTSTKLQIASYKFTGDLYTTNEHDGTIDEVYVADLDGYTGNVSEIVDFLFASGSPDSHQQYPMTVENTAPTTPSGLSLTNPVYVGSTLTATGSGSTDADNDSITYYYEFYNTNSSSTIQAYSTDNTYVIAASDAHDLLRVRTKAYDGTAYSSSYKETNRSVSNTLPTSPSGVTLTNPVYVNSNLVCNPTGSTDADSDAITYKCEFENDDDSTTVQAESTNCTYVVKTTDAHDTLRCNAWAYDYAGHDSGVTTTRDVSNTAPTTPTGLSLTNPVYVGSSLNATGSGSTDADNDSITYYYEFYNTNSSTTIQAYSTDNTYVIAASDAHDLIRVRTKAYDGTAYSSSYKETNRTVSNTLPIVANVTLIGTVNYTVDNLRFTNTTTDVDSDTINEWSIIWYKNAVQQTILNNASIVNTSYLVLGDNWSISLAAFDGFDWSAYLNSSIFTIFDNVTPIITMDTLSSASGYVNSAFTITANFSDNNIINQSLVEITTPTLTTNYSMSLFSGVNNNGIYRYIYTPLEIGNYSFRFIALDDALNIYILNSTLTYISNTMPVISGGGEGGGGCPVGNGIILWQGQCIKASFINSIVFDILDSSVCINSDNNIKLTLMNNEDKIQMANVGVYAYINNNKKELVKSGNSYILYYSLEKPTNITFEAVDMLNGISYKTTIIKEIDIKECTALDFKLLGIKEDIKNTFEGFKQTIYDRFKSTNKSIFILIGLAGIVILALILKQR